MVDSSMLFSDSVSNMIQIVFGDSLPANGIPDETFNIDMSTGGLDAPDIGMSDIGIKVESNIALPEIPIEVKDDAGLFNTFDCFPETQIESVQSIIDAASDLMQGSIELPISFDSNESVSIKSINVTEGIWNMDVSNEFAVPISVIFTLINNESTLYKADFSGETKISPYSTENKNILITNTAPSQIVISESINYFAEIKILDESHDCIGYECSVGGLGYLIESDCNTACTLLGGTCTQYNGWTVDKSKTENLKINFSATFDKIGSVVADVNIEAPSSEPLAIDIPAMEGISITRAKFADYTETYPNQFKFNITNGFIADLLMKMSYKNIFDYDSLGIDSIQLTDSLILPFTISPGTTLDTTISISDKFLAYGSTSEEPVKSIEIDYEVDIASGEYTINVENDSIKIGVPKINTIDVTNMRLEYIAAVTDSLPFPAIESPPIEGIPDGFSGFEFYDIIMEIEFFNEIGVPVGLDMEMLGSKTGVTDTQKVTISTEIGAPYKYNYNCQFSTTGDTARTLIKINKDFQITQY
ncbi:MAG: hypothetical protein QGF57_03840, partial [Candidatus Marinimicrobia bacterium]|nr:hypothetical protein [Candidatus Neomarinimicrobiota bacterium]